jgi:hypothetical protein
MSKAKKIRPSVFLNAAKLVERKLAKGMNYTCCDALQCYVTNNRCYSSIFESEEYLFFKKLFGRKRDAGEYWFGKPYRADGEPNIRNQKRRIAALNKAYKLAKRLK